MNEELLEVKGLHTSFFTHLGEVKAIRDVSFSVHKNEIVGIVGESGSGKSVTSLSIMGLLAHPGRVTGGEILFKGEDLTKVKKGRMRKIQGNQISMIFQDPMTSLNPLFTIGNQITEAILTHQKMTKAEAKKRAVEMLKLVGIPSPEKRYESFPHEFSGGMRHDRHGLILRTGPFDRGRAHHGPGRDHPGSGAVPDEGAQRAPWDRHHSDHP
jgi:oligopeptide transport system ATP-binding protein